jgi:hypothetical protein
MSFGKYRKFVVALVGAAVLFLQLMGQDNDLISVIIAIATALGVYQVPNDPV